MKTTIKFLSAVMCSSVCLSAFANPCLEDENQKVCVGDIVISNTPMFHLSNVNLGSLVFADGTAHSANIISSKIVKIENNKVFVERKGDDPQPHDLKEVIPLQALKDACGQSGYGPICSCDEFEANHRSGIAVAGLTPSQEKALNFQMIKDNGPFANITNLGTANIIAVPNAQDVARIVKGEVVILSPGRTDLLSRFKMKKVAATPGSCLSSLSASSAGTSSDRSGQVIAPATW